MEDIYIKLLKELQMAIDVLQTEISELKKQLAAKQETHYHYHYHYPENPPQLGPIWGGSGTPINPIPCTPYTWPTVICSEGNVTVSSPGWTTVSSTGTIGGHSQSINDPGHGHKLS